MKLGSVTWLAFGPNASAMCFDDVARNGQPQANAIRRSPAAAGVQSDMGFEHGAKRVCVESGPFVANNDVRLACFASEDDGDLAARRVRRGVRQQIDKYLREAAAIS